MEMMLDRGILTDTDLIPAIARRHVFPCWFGSALKLQGVDALVEGLDRYTRPAPALEAFGAKVFKVSQDEQGNRLTWLRVTGGVLKVKAQLTGEVDGEPWPKRPISCGSTPAQSLRWRSASAPARCAPLPA